MIDGSLFISEEQIWHPNAWELVVVERYGFVGFHESQPEVSPCLSDVQVDCVLLKIRKPEYKLEEISLKQGNILVCSNYLPVHSVTFLTMEALEFSVRENTFNFRFKLPDRQNSPWITYTKAIV